MTPRSTALFAILIPALAGCTPDGPPEFFRSALQAKSEYVDSLSRIVDERSAKEAAKTTGKLYDSRMKDARDAMEKVRNDLDGSFQKLRRENFDPKKLDAEMRARMISGVRAYVAYCKDVSYTNVRLKREIDRLKRVENLELLAKARTQLAAGQKASVDGANDCPNLDAIVRSFESGREDRPLRVFSQGVTRADLEKLESGIPGEDLDLATTFDPQKLDAKVPGLDPPPLPRYPDWALDVDKRAGLGLTAR